MDEIFLQESSDELFGELISLGDFDKEFFVSLLNKSSILFNEKKGKYHTLIMDGKKVATVGYIKRMEKYFFQIVVHKDYIGRGLVKYASELISKKYNLAELYVSINKDNLSSLAAHKKAGFRKLHKEDLMYLKSTGGLIKDRIRLYRSFNIQKKIEE